MGKANRTKQGAAVCSLPMMTFNSSNKGHVAVIWCNVDACIKAYGSAKELFRLAAGTAAGQQQQLTGAAVAKQLDIPPRRWRRYCFLKQSLKPVAAGAVCKPGDSMRQIKKVLAAMALPKTVKPLQAVKTGKSCHKRAAHDVQLADQPANKKCRSDPGPACGSAASGGRKKSGKHSLASNANGRTANGGCSIESSSSECSGSENSASESSSSESSSSTSTSSNSTSSSGNSSSRHFSSSSDAETSTTSESSPARSRQPAPKRPRRAAGQALQSVLQPAAKLAKLSTPPSALQTRHATAPTMTAAGSVKTDSTSTSGTSSSSSTSSGSSQLSQTTSGSTTSSSTTSSSTSKSSSSTSSSAQTASTSGTSGTASSLPAQPPAAETGKQANGSAALPATVRVYVRCKAGGSITAVWLNLHKVCAAPGTHPQYRQTPDQPGAAAVGALPVLTKTELQAMAGWGIGGALRTQPHLAEPLIFRGDVLPAGMPVPKVSKKFRAALPIDNKRAQQVQERIFKLWEQQLDQLGCRMCHADWSCSVGTKANTAHQVVWHGQGFWGQEQALKAVRLYTHCVHASCNVSSTQQAAQPVKVYVQHPGDKQTRCWALWTNWQQVLKPKGFPLFIICKDSSYTPRDPDSQPVSGMRLQPGATNWVHVTFLQQDVLLDGIKFPAGTQLRWMMPAARAIRMQLDKDKEGAPMFTGSGT